MKKTMLTAILMLFAAVVAQAQNLTVHGTVISRNDGEPLIGATVLSDATKNGVATDLDGNFTLSVPENSTLTFSYIGYQPTTLKAEANMTVYLDELSDLLDEVVVTGYTVQRKADLTGAVSVMNMKEPLSENSGNIMNSMAGKLPGVNVVPDAAPGGTGSIRVRGMSTANSSNDPLYIIDGVPTDNINCINPSDIESMQVLNLVVPCSGRIHIMNRQTDLIGISFGDCPLVTRDSFSNRSSAFETSLDNTCTRGKFRPLGQITHLQVTAICHCSAVRRVNTGYYIEQSCLAGAIFCNNSNLVYECGL